MVLRLRRVGFLTGQGSAVGFCAPKAEFNGDGRMRTYIRMVPVLEAPSILVLAHVLVGEPDPPSGQARGHASREHALAELVGTCAGSRAFPAIDDQIFGPDRAPVEEVLQNFQRAGSVARLRGERGA
jgi:hypothetical protein